VLVCVHTHTYIHTTWFKKKVTLADVHNEAGSDPYRLTTWCRVLPEKLTSPHLIRFYGTGLFITVFTGPHPLFLSWAQSLSPSPRPCAVLCNVVSFYSYDLLAIHPIPKLEDHPFLADHICLFSIFAATFHIVRLFLHSQPKDAPCFCDRHQLTMEAVSLQRCNVYTVQTVFLL